MSPTNARTMTVLVKEEHLLAQMGKQKFRQTTINEDPNLLSSHIGPNLIWAPNIRPISCRRWPGTGYCQRPSISLPFRLSYLLPLPPFLFHKHHHGARVHRQRGVATDPSQPTGRLPPIAAIRLFSSSFSFLSSSFPFLSLLPLFFLSSLCPMVWQLDRPSPDQPTTTGPIRIDCHWPLFGPDESRLAVGSLPTKIESRSNAAPRFHLGSRAATLSSSIEAHHQWRALLGRTAYPQYLSCGWNNTIGVIGVRRPYMAVPTVASGRRHYFRFLSHPLFYTQNRAYEGSCWRDESTRQCDDGFNEGFRPFRAYHRSQG